MNWSQDISTAPRGKMVPVTRTTKDGPKAGEEYRREFILAVQPDGVVAQSYWIPPRYTQTGKLLEGNRWSGFNLGADPIAWAPWPSYEADKLDLAAAAVVDHLNIPMLDDCGSGT